MSNEARENLSPKIQKRLKKFDDLIAEFQKESATFKTLGE